MIKLFNQYISFHKLVFILGEGALIFFAALLATYITLGRGIGLIGTLEIVWPKLLLVTIITQLSLYFNDLYEIRATDNKIDIAARLIQAIGITSITLAIIYFIWPDMVIGQWIFFISLIFLLLFLLSWRFLYYIVVKKRLFTERTILLGTGSLACDLLEELKFRRDIGYNIVMAICQDNHQEICELPLKIPVKQGFEDLCELVSKENASTVIVALDQKRGIMPYKELLNCKVQGIKIIDGESFYEKIAEKLLVEKINPSWLIFSEGFQKSKITRFFKRFSDFIMSIILLVLLLPFLALVAIIIKSESKGPALFSQERVGENGVPFILYKFRSMRSDAEKLSGPVWAEEDDPRVTKVGKIMRKLRIDELPQLWNVFRGEMSFVGPRPERRFFIDQLLKSVPYYNERFSVKPGVTGWAQIKYPYGSTEKDALEKLKYDLYYIKNLSFAFDLTIIFHTVKIMLLGRGAR
jgi:sugar transferase (PEP-CTERM system associated)